MKITFSNLGAIKKTTLDLRPLTVIIGPNNSNKTYIAYSIYGLLNALCTRATSKLLHNLGYKFDHISQSENNNLYQIESGEYSIKIDKKFLQAFREDCQELVHKFENQLSIFFQDSSGKLFRDTKFKVDFAEVDLKEKIKRLIKQANFTNSQDYEFTFGNTLKVKFLGADIFKKDSISIDVATVLGLNLRSLLYPKPLLLPAERNALIITYKILENRRYNLLKDASRESIQQSSLLPKDLFQQIDIRYPQPIENFLYFLTNLEIETGSGKAGKFGNLALNIEKNLQNDNKTNFITKEIGGKEIKINVEKGLDIDLYNASSSIKQLAPLLLYLRYRAKENDLLIIDEPEMNLHPESQAKLLEVLGRLVNAGVNVLLTTHSPYFMSHLNNLISGDMTDEKIREGQAKSLYLNDARAFLSPNEVSAYEMKKDKSGNQTLHDLKDKDYGIRWDTLSDVSADIQQKFFEIYEKGKETSNGREK